MGWAPLPDAEDAAQKTVENITAEIDNKVAAAEDSKRLRLICFKRCG